MCLVKSTCSSGFYQDILILFGQTQPKNSLLSKCISFNFYTPTAPFSVFHDGLLKATSSSKYVTLFTGSAVQVNFTSGHGGYVVLCF